MRMLICSVAAVMLAWTVVMGGAGGPETRPATRKGDSPVRRHWFVSGDVQGVGFRAYVHRHATDLKLRGWVRNLFDGRVEIVADGPADKINDLFDVVKKGPAMSRVEHLVDAKVDAAEKLGEEFQIRTTAKAP